MTFLFVALVSASAVLLTICAVAYQNPRYDWTWYAGVVALTLAALTALLNGWSA